MGIDAGGAGSIAQRWRRPRSDPEYTERRSDTVQAAEKCSRSDFIDGERHPHPSHRWVQKAKSGHPGMPMGMAEIALAVWHRHLKHNPANPHWPDRDRFIVSNGHGSMLLYALLHLSGYDLPIEQLK